jgi:glycosyltransferase involved in cell wall biosynthesis
MPPRSSRPKVAVLAWDVGHPSLGRAHMLAGVLQRRFEVEIWGAQFERHGSRLWPPVRHAGVTIHRFDGKALPEHLGVMEDVARRIDADAVWVSKPRLPSLALGILAKEARNRPLLLDLDDHELAYFGEDAGLYLQEIERQQRRLDLTLPFESAWTRACEPLIGEADALTVGSVALQHRHGGVLVPPARDERLFDPSRFDRAEARHRLGVSDADRVLLYGSLPPHRGSHDLRALLTSLERLGDRRCRVVVLGGDELEGLADDLGDLTRWVLPLFHRRIDELPELLAAADVAGALSDPTDPVGRYHAPARVTDALAMGVPCLVSPLPSVRPLLDEGVVQPVTDEATLHARLAEIFDEPGPALERARRGREVFLDSYSYAAVGQQIGPMLDRLLDAPLAPSPELRRLVDLPRRLFASDPPPVPTQAVVVETVAADLHTATPDGRKPTSAPVPPPAARDVAPDPMILALARHRFGGTADTWPDRALPRHRWDRLIDDVVQQRLSGLLIAAIDDGALTVDHAQEAEARALELRDAERALVLEAALVRLVADLEERGIAHRVLKGPAMAHLVYAEHSLRPFRDIDLLVPGPDIGEVARLLVGAGAVRRFASPRPGFDERFSKGMNLRLVDGVDIDLHRTLALGPFGLSLSPDDLFATATPFELAGQRLLALGPDERLLHAAYHATLGDWPPLQLAHRDVAELLVSGTVDEDRVLELIERWDGGAPTATAIVQAAAWFGLDGSVPLVRWAQELVLTAADHRRLALYRSGDSRAMSAAGVLALTRLRDRLAYARMLLLPDRAYVAEHDGRYSTRLRRSVQVARRMAPGGHSRDPGGDTRRAVGGDEPATAPPRPHRASQARTTSEPRDDSPARGSVAAAPARDPDAPVRISTTGVLWRRVADGLLVHELSSSTTVQLNATGYLLWGLLAETPQSPAALADRLATELDLPAEQVRSDVCSFVDQLEGAGLLTAR